MKTSLSMSQSMAELEHKQTRPKCTRNVNFFGEFYFSTRWHLIWAQISQERALCVCGWMAAHLPLP